MDIRGLPDGTAEVLNEYRIQICIPGQFQGVIEIFPTFRTDFSSFPTLASWIVDWRRVAVAGLVHDFLYSTVGCITYPDLSRSQKDQVWRHLAMKSNGKDAKGANWFQAGISWLGIRLGGAKYERKVVIKDILNGRKERTEIGK